MTKESLSATAALVMLWAERTLYSSSVVQAYLNSLDMSAGIDLYDECQTIWSDYSNVINNRKWLISNWSKEILASGQISQVVILGAGWAPLGLELADLYPKASVFELDIENMDKKKGLVDRIPGAPSNISFMSTDITDHDRCFSDLKIAGWKHDLPSLLIFEGISYYLKKADLARLVTLGGIHSRVIVEFMINLSRVDKSRREIPKKVFGLIEKACSLQTPIQTWDYQELCQRVHGVVMRHVNLSQIESMRQEIDGFVRKIFPAPETGWIEIVDIGLVKEDEC